MRNVARRRIAAHKAGNEVVCIVSAMSGETHRLLKLAHELANVPDACEIFTDVDGVYTTDANVCPSARTIAKISFEEMLELASLGAKVLQIRSVEIAMKYGVPVHVRSSFNESSGTWVTKEDKSLEN